MVVTAEQLRALHATGTDQETPPPAHHQHDEFNLLDILVRLGIPYEQDKHDGYDRYKLAHCPFNPEHGKGEAAILQLSNGALVFKCFHNSCAGNHWKEFRTLVDGRQANANSCGNGRIQIPPRGDDDFHIVPTSFVLRDPKEIPPREWLYGHVYLRGAVSVTAGGGGIGKSSLLMTEALAMVSGRDLLGIQPRQQDGGLRVWILNLEESSDELERRGAAAMVRHGVNQEDIEQRLYINSGLGFSEPLVITEQIAKGTKIVQPLIEHLIDVIKSMMIDVLIIDPFVSCHNVNENDNSAIDQVVKAWASVAYQSNCNVHLSHHVRKHKSEEVTVEHSRGAQAMVDGVRYARVLNQMTADEASDMGESNRLLCFRASDGKANLSLRSDAKDWYMLDSINLCNGPDGFSGDSVGVVTKKSDRTMIETPDVLKIQEAIKSCSHNLRKDIRADHWVGKLIAEVLNLDIEENKRRISKIHFYMINRGYLEPYEDKDADRQKRWFVKVGIEPE